MSAETRLLDRFVNYALGLSGVRARDYVAATALAILPATFAFVALGNSLSDPSSPGFALSLAMVLGLAIGAPLADRAWRRYKARLGVTAAR